MQLSFMSLYDEYDTKPHIPDLRGESVNRRTDCCFLAPDSPWVGEGGGVAITRCR